MTIVGAGPAGLACAIVLARAGVPVIVREWRASVGSRFHGDFQGLENWSDRLDVREELQRAGIEATFDWHPVSHGTAFDAWDRAYPIWARKPLYYLVRRGSEEGTLDAGLLKQAVDAGVDVRLGDRARDAGDAMVLAIGPRTPDAIAAGYVFETDKPDGSWIVFNNALAPLGYSYLLIHEGRGTLASCMFTDFKRQAQYVERTVDFFLQRAGLEMRNERTFGGYANFRVPRTATQGGRRVIGEQAGFQDALAGFGMRYALRSGILAARSLVDGTDYTEIWQRELMPLLRTGVSNRFIFNHVGDWCWRRVLRGLSRSDPTERLLKLYRPSLLTRLVFPIAHRRYRASLADPSCDHVDCGCVWCQCGGSAEHTSSDHGESHMDNVVPMRLANHGVQDK